ncbi:GtrA family protein [Aquibacillus salsiterrae]|uniref:GtrA family protein n=1 Tax=Aquibacillus salsiterrae TaxID=2950439 RepID=A0A9X3WI61_9BACI|nr:GtrA family protein [Aquibacillus salsiterrae]MDC3417899.1 GtrA family protein [Aquibacillus salsiterrae]
MAKKLKTQVLQFGFIGASNAVVDILSLNILLLIWPTKGTGMLLTFNTISYILAIINSYIWNTKFTFSHRATSDTREMFLFIIQASIALVISNLVFIGAFQLLEVQPLLPIPSFINQNIAKGLAMFLSSTASFLLMRYLVFRKRETRQTE